MSDCQHSELRRGENGNWFCVSRSDCNFEIHESVAQRTEQRPVDKRFTVEVALNEAQRCRRYLDPVQNEMVIVVLADEVLRLRGTEALNAQDPRQR